MYRHEFLKRIDDVVLDYLLDYHYQKLMDRTITLEERALYYELYEALTIEKRFRSDENGN